MSERRLVPMQIMADLCATGSVSLAEAIETDKGWRVTFRLGKDRFSYSQVGLRASRGGERFYKSLDSLCDLLKKLRCTVLAVSVNQRVLSDAEPKKPKAPHPRTGRAEVGMERLYALKEKERKTFLTKAEREEKKHLETKYHWNN